MNWHVYHFRGYIEASFATAAECAQYITKAANPTEYYFEYQEL
jgi:hypothetical protein